MGISPAGNNTLTRMAKITTSAREVKYALQLVHHGRTKFSTVSLDLFFFRSYFGFFLLNIGPSSVDSSMQYVTENSPDYGSDNEEP